MNGEIAWAEAAQQHSKAACPPQRWLDVLLTLDVLVIGLWFERWLAKAVFTIAWPTAARQKFVCWTRIVRLCVGKHFRFLYCFIAFF